MKKQMALFKIDRPKKKDEKPDYSGIAKAVSKKRLDGLKIELEKYRKWHGEQMTFNVVKSTVEIMGKFREEDAY